MPLLPKARPSTGDTTRVKVETKDTAIPNDRKRSWRPTQSSLTREEMQRIVLDVLG